MLKDFEKIFKKNKSIFLVILCGLIVIGAVLYIHNNNKNLSESFHYPKFVKIRTVDGDKLSDDHAENVNIPVVNNEDDMGSNNNDTENVSNDSSQSGEKYPSSEIRDQVVPSKNVPEHVVAAEEASRVVARNGGSAQEQAMAAATASRESGGTIEQQVKAAGKAADTAGVSNEVKEQIKNIVIKESTSVGDIDNSVGSVDPQQTDLTLNSGETVESEQTGAGGTVESEKIGTGGTVVNGEMVDTVKNNNVGSNNGTFIYNLKENHSCGSKKIHNEIITADDNLNNYTTSEPHSIPYSNPKLDSTHGWHPRRRSKNEFVELDIGYKTWLIGVITQTRGNHNQFVKTYKIKTSLDGTNWIDHDRIFNGNRNGDYQNKTKSTSILRNNIETRYVRIIPQTWHGHPSMRVGIEITNKCQDNNDLEIDGKNFIEASRDNIQDCYKKCNNNMECGGIHYSENDKKCYFRKDGSCNMIKDEASDCYTKFKSIDDTGGEGFLDYMSGFTQNCSVWKK